MDVVCTAPSPLYHRVLPDVIDDNMELCTKINPFFPNLPLIGYFIKVIGENKADIVMKKCYTLGFQKPYSRNYTGVHYAGINLRYDKPVLGNTHACRNNANIHCVVIM